MPIEEEMKKELDELLKDAEKDIARAGTQAKKRIESFVTMIKNAATLVLPKNTVDILRKGGIVFAKDINVQSPGEVTVTICNYKMIEYPDQPKLKEPGKYKLILILEKL